MEAADQTQSRTCPSARAIALARRLQPDHRCAAAGHSIRSVLPHLDELDIGDAVAGSACPQQALAEALVCSRVDALQYLRKTVVEEPCVSVLDELLQLLLLGSNSLKKEF